MTAARNPAAAAGRATSSEINSDDINCTLKITSSNSIISFFSTFAFEIIIDLENISKIMQRGKSHVPLPQVSLMVVSCVTIVQRQAQGIDIGTTCVYSYMPFLSHM